MSLSTERLLLRHCCESDAESIYKYACHPDVGYNAGWVAHPNVEYTKMIIKTVLSGPEDYSIVLKETNEVIGCMGIMFNKTSTNTNIPQTEGEIGYWIGVPHWGKGLMTEAVKELIRHGFEDLKLSKIWCGYYEGNNRSKRVQEKCGFKFHHSEPNVTTQIPLDKRDANILCLEREEWNSLKGK